MPTTKTLWSVSKNGEHCRCELMLHERGHARVSLLRPQGEDFFSEGTDTADLAIELAERLKEEFIAAGWVLDMPDDQAPADAPSDSAPRYRCPICSAALTAVRRSSGRRIEPVVYWRCAEHGLYKLAPGGALIKC